MPAGRPTTYTAEIANRICEWIAQDKSLVSFCSIDGNPGLTTVYQWIYKDPEFEEKYTRAREDQAETVADQVSEIKKKVASGEIMPDVARVLIDSIKWESGKRCGKRYGERVAVDHGAQQSLADLVRSSYTPRDGEK